MIIQALSHTIRHNITIIILLDIFLPARHQSAILPSTTQSATHNKILSHPPLSRIHIRQICSLTAKPKEPGIPRFPHSMTPGSISPTKYYQQFTERTGKGPKKKKSTSKIAKRKPKKKTIIIDNSSNSILSHQRPNNTNNSFRL